MTRSNRFCERRDSLLSGCLVVAMETTVVVGGRGER